MFNLKPVTAAVITLAITGPALSEEVVIRAGGATGRGFTVSAGNECLVVTPKHVVTRDDGATVRLVEVQGSLNTRSEATIVRMHPDADLALLSLATPSAVRCADSDYAALPAGLQAVTRLENGIAKFFDVTLAGENPPEIFVESELEVTQGYSGSSLYLNGDRIGVVYALMPDTGLIRVYTLDYIYAALNLGQLRPMDLDEARVALDRAIERKDGSLQGQNVAISTLTALGYTFRGSDFSGVSLDGAVVANGDISGARLHFTSLREANASKLDLSGSGLRFGYLEDANLAEADLSKVFAPFVDARGVQAPNARMAGANFQLADFRGANLRGADLSMASFAFADLTGADLRGADLSGAYFIGAVMIDAKLDGAKLDETSLLGAVLPAASLTDAQAAAACRHDGSFRGGFDIRLLERWPSDRYDSGYQFEDLLEYARLPWIAEMDDTSLRICASPGEGAVGFNAAYPMSVGMHLDREYLDRAGRKGEAETRVFDAIERVQVARAAEGTFRGTGRHVEDWVAAMWSAAASGEVAGTPFADSELIHLHLVDQGVLELDQDLLTRLFNARHRQERLLANGSEEGALGGGVWPRFFPADAPLEEIPNEGFEAYRAWTERRLEVLDERVTVRAPGCVRPSGGGYVFATATGYLATMPEGTYFPNQVSWPRSSWADAMQRRAGGPERLVGAPVRSMANGAARPILFAFPEPYRRYVLDIEQDVAESLPECTTETELDLRITGAATDEDGGTSVLLFVEPAEFRIYQNGRVVAQGLMRLQG